MTVPEMVGTIKVACEPLVLIDKGRVVLSLVDLVIVLAGTNEDTVIDDVVTTEACIEVEVPDMKLEPVVSEVGIVALAERVVDGEANVVYLCDEAD